MLSNTLRGKCASCTCISVDTGVSVTFIRCATRRLSLYAPHALATCAKKKKEDKKKKEEKAEKERNKRSCIACSDSFRLFFPVHRVSYSRAIASYGITDTGNERSSGPLNCCIPEKKPHKWHGQDVRECVHIIVYHYIINGRKVWPLTTSRTICPLIDRSHRHR